MEVPDLGERLRRLELELEALQRIKTQEDYDEGARLHAIKNAPWISGQYSHLEFKPYTHQEYPKAIYGVGYLEAKREYEEALMIPAFGQDDIARKTAIMLAERAVGKCVKKVVSEGELRKWFSSGDWFESPTELEERARKFQKDIEAAASHRAYEDRNMGDGARREFGKFDDAADHFVAEMPQTRLGPKGRKVTSDTAIKAARAAGGHDGEKGTRKEASGRSGKR